MSITITGPALLAKLAENRGLVELQDPAGETVGRVQTTWPSPRSVLSDSQDCFVEMVSDPALLIAFEQVESPVLLFDPCGELVGLFEREWFMMPLTPARVRALKERSRAARNSTGHTLAEVWKIIHEKYVGNEIEALIVETNKEPD